LFTYSKLSTKAQWVLLKYANDHGCKQLFHFCGGKIIATCCLSNNKKFFIAFRMFLETLWGAIPQLPPANDVGVIDESYT